VVRHYFPQSANGEVATNSNFPPQSGAENASSPVGGTMEYEDFVGMEYEDNDDMDYESGANIPTNWFDTDFKQRNLITINSNQVPSTQIDFPFLLNEISNSDFNVMNSNGDDVRFVSVNGVTVFDVEIEEADNSSGDLIAWAKIPSISDVTQFYVYYNNPSASSAGTSTGVWSNYKAVYHLNQSVLGANSTIDSTGNNNDGTPQNLLIGDLQATGKIDGGINFPGVDEEIDVVNNGSLNIVNDITLEAWIKVPIATGGCMFQRSTGSAGYRFVIFDLRVFLVLFTTPTGGVSSGGATDVNDDTFHHVLARRNSSGDLEIFLDGVKDNAVTPNRTEPIADSATLASIGGDHFGFFNGILDEVRVTNIALSNDFITTQFNNQSSPSSFYTISSAQIIP